MRYQPLLTGGPRKRPYAMDKEELYFEPTVLLCDETEVALLKRHIQKLNRKIEQLKYALTKCEQCGVTGGEHDLTCVNYE